MSRRSEVWTHFMRKDNNLQSAVCNKCGKTIGCKGSSTTPMINHLKSHNISLNNTIIENDRKKTKFEKPTTSTLLNFIKKESLEEILSRVAAVDGMSIIAITKSKAIKGYVESKGYIMPKSATTITSKIIQFYEEKRDKLRITFQNCKKENRSFSITVDEWTDCAITRYLNVTVHVFGTDDKTFESHVLGLCEIKGTGNAENIKMLVVNKLKEFDINIESDVIASTNDGAAVMKKYGTSLNIINQLCFNHAFHLAVMDCLYQKKNISRHCQREENDSDEDSLDNIDDSDEDMAENNSEETIQDVLLSHNVEVVEEENYLMQDNIGIVLQKIRKIIRIFKKSPVKNSILQENIFQQEKKKLKLLLDIKIRWNSMIVMIKRFLQVAGPVNKTLADMNLDIVSESELTILRNLLDILAPMEVAIKELSNNNITLLRPREFINLYLISWKNLEVH